MNTEGDLMSMLSSVPLLAPKQENIADYRHSGRIHLAWRRLIVRHGTVFFFLSRSWDF